MTTEATNTHVPLYPNLECPHCKKVEPCKYEGRVIGEPRLQYRCSTCKKIFEITHAKVPLLAQMPGSDAPEQPQPAAMAPFGIIDGITAEDLVTALKPLIEENKHLHAESKRLYRIIEERNNMITALQQSMERWWKTEANETATHTIPPAAEPEPDAG